MNVALKIFAISFLSHLSDAATFNLKESIREAFGDDSDVPSWLTSLGEGFEQLNDALNTTNNRLSKLSKSKIYD